MCITVALLSVSMPGELSEVGHSVLNPEIPQAH